MGRVEFGADRAGGSPTGAFAAWSGAVRAAALRAVGGSANLRMVAVLAAVVALDGADKGTVSASASNLQHAFGIDDTRIGLLATVTSLVGVLATVPAGVLTDRVRRTRLLSISIGVWALALACGAASPSYGWLLASRLALGVVMAAAGPAVASLTGDSFPAHDRARIYGFILAGEMAGTGVGYVASGALAGSLGWRSAFAWLVVPSLTLALVLWRQAEPERGRQRPASAGGADPVTQAVAAEHIKPYDRQILRSDPRQWRLGEAFRYVLRVRTNVVIIAASAVGYFYFGGIRTFAILYIQGHYGVTKVVASLLVLVVGLGGLVGTLAGGRLADLLLARGMINARVIVPAVVLFTIPVVVAPGFLTAQVWLSIPLLTAGATLLGAANPPQDALRLDIIHPLLWGRSEGVRTALRGLADAAAPLTFGLVSDHLFGSKVNSSGDSTAVVSPTQGHALAMTFLAFLVTLLIAGAIVLVALRTYPRDVATAAASVDHDGCAAAYPAEREDRTKP